MLAFHSAKKIIHLVTSNLTCWDFYYDLHRPSWHHVLGPRHKCEDYWIEEGAQLQLEFDYIACKTTNLRQVTQSLWGSVSSSVGMGIKRFVLQSCSLWRLNNLWQEVKQQSQTFSLFPLFLSFLHKICTFSSYNLLFSMLLGIFHLHENTQGGSRVWTRAAWYDWLRPSNCPLPKCGIPRSRSWGHELK